MGIPSSTNKITAGFHAVAEARQVGVSAKFGLLERAVSPDVALAIKGSVQLARGVVVATVVSVDSEEKSAAYSMPSSLVKGP